MPRLVTELHAQFAESAKLEQAINLSAVAFLTFVGLAKKVAKVEANLPARRSAQREGGRGLGYGD